MPCPRTATVFAITFAFLCAAPNTAAPESPPSKEQIARLIEQLGADDFDVREKASQSLWQAGEAAEAALKAALKSTDAEVARRAQNLLERISWGITPSTPEPVVKLITQYRGGDDNARAGAVKELFKLGRAGYAVVSKMARAEQDAEARKKLSGWIAQEGSQAAGVLLIEGDPAAAEELLEAGLAGGDEAALRNFAAYHLLRGSLEKQIAEFRNRVEQGKDKNAAAVLTFLYRARGDLKNARRAAERGEKLDLVEAIADEMGDWKTVAKALAQRPLNQPDQPPPPGAHSVSPNLRAVYHRLAGNTREFEADLAKIRAQKGWEAARGLFANDLPHEAVAALIEAKLPASAFEFLVQQGKFREALELADKGGQDKDVKPAEKSALLARKAGLLYLLGKNDEATKLFNRLGDAIKDIENLEYAHFRLVEEEYKAGLTDLAFDHCARLLGRDKDGSGSFGRSGLFDQVFPKKGSTADLWWRFLRPQFPNEEPAATLKRVRDVMGGKMAAKDLRPLLEQAEQASRGQERTPREQWLLALSEAAGAVGEDGQALSYLEKDGAETTSQVLQQQGDFLAERKRWDEAARRYRQAWERDRQSASVLYLHGWALKQAGRAADGDKALEQAHLLSLGREDVRSALVQALADKGLTEGARGEREFLARTGSFRSVYVSNVLDDLSDDAVARKDYFQAAENYQRISLIVQQAGAMFLENEAYVLVPARIHLYRACGLAQAGRLEEARKEMAVGFDALPGDVDGVIALVPAFEKGGHQEEADRLFARTLAGRVDLCKEYPRSAWCHNSVAWLSARCRRELDRAREHAQKAVELAPKTAGYWDTLAEVHFQRGEQARAVEAAKKCVELEPKNAHYRKQLRRFEAGDRDAPVPSE
jgi:tetratricopeptide (TPR) repeat protein